MSWNKGIATICLGAVVALCGCSLLGSEKEAISFSTMEDAYAASDTVALQLENNRKQVFQYDWCGLSLSAQAGDQWKVVWKQQGCYPGLIPVEPGGRRTIEIALPEGIVGGEYRYQLAGYLGEQAQQPHAITSNQYTVHK